MNKRLRFERDRTVWIASGKVELGQGINTALAQIAAEELDVALERIRIVPPSTAHSPDEGYTSGSMSVQEGGKNLREACVQARGMLLAHAAELLGAPIGELTVEDGTIKARNGSRVTYWECAAEATEAPPAGAGLKPSGPSRVVGNSAPRIDLPAKVAGKPAYLHDMTLPGMLFGRIVRPSKPFRALKELNPDGLQDAVLVIDGSFVGVLAEREEAAIAAAARLRARAVWEEALVPEDYHAWLRANVSERVVLKEVKGAPAGRLLKASYAKQFVAHASIGPSCAIARLRNGKLEVWTHSQGIFGLRHELSIVLGISRDDITVTHAEGAGCYGHNGADDAALDAALLARAAAGRPVKLQWMREDEFAWEPYGPAMAIDLEASLDGAGNVVSWKHELWSNGHTHRPGRSPKPALIAAEHLEKALERTHAIDPALPPGGSERNAIPLYEFPVLQVAKNYVRETPRRASSLRALGAYGNVFAIESFMDELAAAAGADPIEFRLRHLKDPRGRAVVERLLGDFRAFKKAEAKGHGIAFARYKNIGAYCAVLAEVEAGEALRVTRLVVAADVGLAINPDGVANQLEGGAIQSASWTLKEEGRLGAVNWEDYPILTFSEVPRVEVMLIESQNPSLGAGEAAQGPTAAAIANALHDALGVRVRELPLTPERIVKAIG
ncbi:MAG TPA: molybdopterin cofactor-binding domain-containing protein [Burkholderiales bacterium]|nr:molybdopterin cofactor-binding domain-containing protein [Burkholderiales bacterium]